MATSPPTPETSSKRLSSIFINAPYGAAYQDVFLAYVVGAVSLGLTPRAAIEEYNTGVSRLERIHALISGCKYSIHDLSFVDLDETVGLPRFNMPLELGIAIAERYRTSGKHQHEWIAFDSRPYRQIMSTSDLNGFDALSHGGTSDGVLRELLSSIEADPAPSYPQMRSLLRAVKDSLPDHYQATRQTHIFSPIMFQRVVSTAVTISQS